jgi:hypothetical protein
LTVAQTAQNVACAANTFTTNIIQRCQQANLYVSLLAGRLTWRGARRWFLPVFTPTIWLNVASGFRLKPAKHMIAMHHRVKIVVYLFATLILQQIMLNADLLQTITCQMKIRLHAMARA